MRIKSYLVAPLILLIVVLLIFRGLGALGVTPLAGWHDAMRFALAVMFCFTAYAHFGKSRDDLVRMVPSWIPRPREVIMATGGLEFLGAIGLLVSATRTPAGLCLAALMVAMFPANVHAARQQVAIAGKPATPLWFRTLVQLVFIAALVWVAL
jgi:uncharacterized membrane protein